MAYMVLHHKSLEQNSFCVHLSFQVLFQTSSYQSYNPRLGNAVALKVKSMQAAAEQSPSHKSQDHAHTHAHEQWLKTHKWQLDAGGAFLCLLQCTLLTIERKALPLGNLPSDLLHIFCKVMVGCGWLHHCLSRDCWGRSRHGSYSSKMPMSVLPVDIPHSTVSKALHIRQALQVRNCIWRRTWHVCGRCCKMATASSNCQPYLFKENYCRAHQAHCLQFMSLFVSCPTVTEYSIYKSICSVCIAYCVEISYGTLNTEGIFV